MKNREIAEKKEKKNNDNKIVQENIIMRSFHAFYPSIQIYFLFQCFYFLKILTSSKWTNIIKMLLNNRNTFKHLI